MGTVLKFVFIVMLCVAVITMGLAFIIYYTAPEFEIGTKSFYTDRNLKDIVQQASSIADQSNAAIDKAWKDYFLSLKKEI